MVEMKLQYLHLHGRLEQESTWYFNSSESPTQSHPCDLCGHLTLIPDPLRLSEYGCISRCELEADFEADLDDECLFPFVLVELIDHCDKLILLAYALARLAAIVNFAHSTVDIDRTDKLASKVLPAN